LVPARARARWGRRPRLNIACCRAVSTSRRASRRRQPGGLAPRALGTPRPTGRRRQRPEALTDAEQRILRLLASDLTVREIGRELYLSLNTVRTHVYSIHRKLRVTSAPTL
jgi:DNA-binding CsgD family transcriptional regulator